MAKKPSAASAKKSPVKKASAKGVKSIAKKLSSGTKSKSSVVKKSPAKKGKTPVKKVLTDKERELREANVIANSEKKKKPAASKRPKKITTEKETSTLLDAIVEGMQERKAKNILIMNLQEIENRVTDYFVICDADSNTHVNSIADSVEEMVEKLAKEKAYHTEGSQNGEWILMDYINIVVHVFLRETREHYNIEGLWGDAEITHIKN
ncbi:ribosome silencing factor [Aurantibacillus circumpalustris]|uniref:ribosome silencing factor n=1 Tax=Aurantibacillus circumpalustris TaxID=3036359 RepID=UPI00295BEB4B|nr:ribosome silencing factor [Aurantibacillus circumpalustris]